MFDIILVTYNRLSMLKDCIDNLKNVGYSNIFIINNNSDDGTKEYLEELTEINNKIKAFHLNKNVGGAGGFNYGTKKFFSESQSNYFCLMDDDTFPEKDSLKNLVNELEKIPNNERGFATGNVRWIDGNKAKMNIPSFSFCNEIINSNRIVDSATFVALMVNREASIKVGLPISEFFIWGDDTEYTLRLTKNDKKGIYVENAYITHKMKENNNTNILKENSNISRINRYFYAFRNNFYIRKQISIIKVFKYVVKNIVMGFKIIFSNSKYKLLKLKVIFTSTFSGLFFSPKIEYFDDKNN